MDEKLRYLKIWQNAVKNAGSALKNGDIAGAEKYHQQMEDAYERYKEIVNHESMIQNAQFSTLSATLESVLPKLYVGKKGGVLKECMDIIRNDKNLSAQYKFFNALRSFNCDSDATDYVNESLELVMKDINHKTLKESNRKLADFILKHNLKCGELSDEQIKFNESCDYLLKNRKKLTNLTEVTNNIKVVSDYITEHKNNTTVDSILEKMDKLNDKMKSLNESEIEFVNTIVSAKSPTMESRRRRLFDKIKNECIAIINNVIAESNGEEKNRLMTMKETVLMKEYDSHTVVKDIAKLLEIGSILGDEKRDKYL